ncbi:uncharacterized protein G2W53_005173 [Senna tora]|uniref:Uncharacterized protein n=1 Tax=Senna tora TaxID=362788 RepID=A0A834XCR9_9FABA|nr:uncharacterized protein G2W53_005173 [Senna tora]
MSRVYKRGKKRLTSENPGKESSIQARGKKERQDLNQSVIKRRKKENPRIAYPAIWMEEGGSENPNF